jgi:hypothetical protein
MKSVERETLEHLKTLSGIVGELAQRVTKLEQLELVEPVVRLARGDQVEIMVAGRTVRVIVEDS